LPGLALIARPAPAVVAVVALAAAAVAAWLWGMDFPLGTQPDEPVKVQEVLLGPSNDHHPLLMIELARAANFFVGLRDPQSVVELGRTLAAVAGGALVIATYMLARLVLPAWVAFAAAVATLATPLVTVHARYFKEDIFVAPLVVLALAALIAALRRPTLRRALALGAVIGLAGGAKYVGGLLLLPYALAVMVAFGAERRIGARLAHAGVVALTAAVVFGLIEAPALSAGPRFLADVRYEYFHAVVGHPDVVLPITLTWGLFHLRESLWPGLGPALAVLGVLGLAAPFCVSAERRRPLAVIAGFALLWYLAHEISPLKPYPDFSRYMVPLAPLLVILAAALIDEWALRSRAGARAAAATIALLVAAAPAAWLSLRINGPAADDPRRLLPAILAHADGRVALDTYAGYAQTPFLTRLTPPPSAADTALVVTSSINYDRYARYGALPPQSAQTQAGAAFYARILALPRLDISNGRPAFAYFNPTTTVVAMDGNAERLAPIAEAIEKLAPSLLVRRNETATTPGQGRF